MLCKFYLAQRVSCKQYHDVKLIIRWVTNIIDVKKNTGQVTGKGNQLYNK